MKTCNLNSANSSITLFKEIFEFPGSLNKEKNTAYGSFDEMYVHIQRKPEILFITSYPPRECGIATYSQDLINAIREKFDSSFSLKVCALEANGTENNYSDEVKYILHTAEQEQYSKLAKKLNADDNLKMIFLQHEFGLYGGVCGDYILNLLSKLKKPVITTFHTVLPNPDNNLKKIVRHIAAYSAKTVVMTNNAATILETEYQLPTEKVTVIPHGTHLISAINSSEKRRKIHFGDRLVLSTFGLLNEGKSIETALDALPKIIKQFPNVIYLILGKTHPTVVKQEGEKYRNFLYEKVLDLNLQNNVLFINKYLSLPDLLEYLQRTDIYLFTSKDPNQAVSGTFAYAMGCGCAVISTPIPHAKELSDGAGLTFDFQNSGQLAVAAIKILSNPVLLEDMRLKALHKINPTAWQNIAIAHIELANSWLVNRWSDNRNAARWNTEYQPLITIRFEIPKISLEHIRRLTTNKAMIQFSKISTPDLESGYTLDDNARALIAVTKHYELTGETADLELINNYLDFIIYCQQNDGKFLNYVDIKGKFFEKNKDENLEDSNGRAIWALGEFMSYNALFPPYLMMKAQSAIDKSLNHIISFKSPRAIAFAIKGLYFYDLEVNSVQLKNIITFLADNLVSKYRGVSNDNWKWFEEYLTYANSLLPEALLYAALSTGSILFKTIAKSSFDFLLSVIFKNDEIKVISNKGWHHKGQSSHPFGEQPIDVAYTVLALGKFYDTFGNKSYLQKMEIAFNWFLGKNHLHQIIYNPCTGGCYDGLEEKHVNLNQGAESTVSYLLARLTIEKYFSKKDFHSISRIKTGKRTRSEKNLENTFVQI